MGKRKKVKRLNQKLSRNKQPSETNTAVKRSTRRKTEAGIPAAREASQKSKIDLNSALTQSKIINTWQNGIFFSEELFEFDPLPFKHGIIMKLIIDNTFLDNLSAELLQLPYDNMINDLYSFRQTVSLFSHKGKFPALQSVLELITGPLQSWVEKLLGKKFTKEVTATASQYTFTDRLLCHDDNLSNRCVAFILYLCKDWDVKYGGSLDLFSCDSESQPRTIVKSLFPRYGSFVFFEVTDKSYHQVAEILSKNSTRLSINGWYHCQNLPEPIEWKEPLPKMLLPIHPRGCSLINWINPAWLDPATLIQIKEAFCKELSVGLQDFLKPSVYKDLLGALKSHSLEWTVCGPANKKRFQVAKKLTLPALAKEFLKLLQSKFWFKYLSQLTVEIDPDVQPKPKCYNEVQHWQPGDYTLLVDDDPINRTTGIDTHLYFDVKKSNKQFEGGVVHYLGPDRNEGGYLEAAAQVETQSNMLTLVGRIEGMASVTKYLDHRNAPYFKIFGHYSQV